ncbi:MAG: hypothetical protein EAZ79_18200 [Oscillatoriales cyanobacterium]|nr:MAG: hypothetical protein EAZ79_18200 [Oscillatoriales cyanobacterium]
MDTEEAEVKQGVKNFDKYRNLGFMSSHPKRDIAAAVNRSSKLGNVDIVAVEFPEQTAISLVATSNGDQLDGSRYVATLNRNLWHSKHREDAVESGCLRNVRTGNIVLLPLVWCWRK